MNYDEWIEKANEFIEMLHYGDEFTLKQLLNGCGWCTLSKDNRIGFGKYFKNKVQNDNIPNIIIISGTGTSKYRKIKKKD
ncbi:MAG: single-stranded DNA-binding protein [Ruminococcus sp.]|nr:single-stranded DNA-binding protein [Ruminococcus sp.]